MKIFIFLSLLLFTVSCHNVSVTTFPISIIDNQFHCTVTIAGRSYNFLIDSGATFTLMNYRKAKEAGISPTDSCYSSVRLIQSQYEGYRYSHYTDLEIGGMTFKCDLILDQYKDSIATYINYDDYDGVLGTDILFQTNWLLDISKCQMVFSHESIPIPSDAHADFHFDAIDKRLIRKISHGNCDLVTLLDTAYGRGEFDLWGYRLPVSLFLAEDDFEHYKQGSFSDGHGVTFTILPELVSDEQSPISDLLVMKIPDFIHLHNGEGLFTNHFLMMFDYAYFSTQENRLTLYNYHAPASVEKFSLQLKQLLQHNTVDTLYFPKISR